MVRSFDGNRFAFFLFKKKNDTKRMKRADVLAGPLAFSGGFLHWRLAAVSLSLSLSLSLFLSFF